MLIYYLMAVPFGMGLVVAVWIGSGVRRGLVVQPIEEVRGIVEDDGLDDLINDGQGAISLD